MTDKVDRVKATDISRGAMVEKAEHPWATKTVARQIAKDHLKENPGYYGRSGEQTGERTVVILNQNVKAVPPHKRKKPVKTESGFNIMTWGNELLR